MARRKKAAKKSSTANPKFKQPLKGSKDQHDGTCIILDVAPEIRNRIYHYTFTPDHSDGLSQNLITAAPPSKALTQVCRLIHDEVKFVYRNAYRQYWKTTHFTLSFSQQVDIDEQLGDTMLALEDMKPDDLAGINHLVVSTYDLGIKQDNVTLTQPAWKWGREESPRYGLWVAPDMVELMLDCGFFVRTETDEPGDGYGWLIFTKPDKPTWFGPVRPFTDEQIEMARELAERERLTKNEAVDAILWATGSLRGGSRDWKKEPAIPVAVPRAWLDAFEVGKDGESK